MHESYPDEIYTESDGSHFDSIRAVYAKGREDALREMEERGGVKAASPWIPFSERRPTKADGDKHGEVLFVWRYGLVCAQGWHMNTGAIAWMPIPAYTPPHPPTLRDAARALLGCIHDGVVTDGVLQALREAVAREEAK